MTAAGDSNVIAPGTAPTPFTAAQIRESCPPGRSITVRVVTGDEPPRLETTRWLGGDAEGAVMEKTVFEQDGSIVSQASSRARWDALQAHASFPEDKTSIDTEVIVTEAGRFECLRYTVQGEGGPSVFWFALELPGMPIRVRAPGWEMDLVEKVG